MSRIIDEIRLRNARQLAEQVGGIPPFAKRMDVTRQYAHHIIGNKAFKPIGRNMARRIEEVFGVPVGWLDVDHSAGSHVKPDEGVVEVPLLDVYGSMGSGAVAPWHEQVVERIAITKHWLRHNVDASAFEHLAIITGKGDSMEPTFTNKALLLVDRGTSSVNDDGVYVLLRDDQLFVKRVQRRLGSKAWRIISDNPTYQPEDVENPGGILTLGRVVAAWNPCKL